ncbi:rho-related GTP-binding protein RhoG-like [Callorhinchus milii]|uniref:rho-related GTP-binding protein RhoG-like n=1 Tax=Callorhinchus milii TaxID=7868 RepID=UPI0004572011|nr:rho-related GTP-binding protein RhoG-like [Callorhinchus milii]|eukprot:gi/632976659/ref/XP_007904918.1/ PREDICTED: rho-related GTP-binding protein RhoG-like [Callorhinchus milii]
MVTIRGLLLGDALVGKTSLIVCFTTGSFPQESMPTVWDTYRARLCVGGRTVSLSVRDTAAQEEHLLAARQFYYPQVDILILCFSVCDPVSFRGVWQNWYPEMLRHCPHLPVLLVGTQIDLRQDSATLLQLLRQETMPITTEQGIALARSIHADTYLECSARHRLGVEMVFEEAARIVLRRWAGHDRGRGSCVLT